MGPIAHWVKENATSRIPGRWVWLDTEATQTLVSGVQVQQWRCGVTCFDSWESHAKHWVKPRWVYHLKPEGLWRYVDSETRKGTRTIVAAHNMGYDVRISDALHWLPALGWVLERWQVRDRSCVLRWRRDDRSLWLIDSVGWLSTSLEKVGGMIDTPKELLPEWTAPDGEWWRRCETDVAILRTAMLECLDWVRNSSLGNWQATAGSMAWANWRHCHYTDRVLVHDNDTAREAERSAAYSGRCEAWRHGDLDGAGWAEWDLPLAYARCALDTAVPTILRTHVVRPTWKYVGARGTKARWLCRAEITTEQPTLPVRADNRIYWPVGTFDGWYWDVELEMARDAGADVRLIEGWRYIAQPALAQWAAWIINVVENDDAGYSPIQRLVAKSWARALIGRFGTRYPQWEDWGPATQPEATLGVLIQAETGKVGRVLSLGGKDFAWLDEVDGMETAPAIMSAIMAECRVRLWAIMNAAGLDHIVYCDTDSVIVDMIGAGNLRKWVAEGNGWGIREKRSWATLAVMGPRQLVVGGTPRLAGVSKRAERTGPDTWAGERWEGLEAAVQAGRADRVIVRPTEWKLGGTDRRREHLVDGGTAPLRAGAPTVASDGLCGALRDL